MDETTKPTATHRALAHHGTDLETEQPVADEPPTSVRNGRQPSDP